MEENSLQEIKRPWQGTTWAWITTIYLAIGIIGAVFLSLSFLLIGSKRIFENDNNLTLIILGIIIFILLIVIPLLLLLYFVIKGFFRGWKWAVIVAIILEILSLIGSLINLEKTSFFGFLFSGFMLYLAIACVQHPFYNKKK